MKLALDEWLKLDAGQDLDAMVKQLDEALRKQMEEAKTREGTANHKTPAATESGDTAFPDLDQMDHLQDEAEKTRRGLEARKLIEEYAYRDLGICTMHPSMRPYDWPYPQGDNVTKPAVNPMRITYEEMTRSEKDLRDNYGRLVNACQLHSCLHRYCLSEAKLKKDEKAKLKTAEDMRKNQLHVEKDAKGEEKYYACRFGYPMPYYAYEPTYVPGNKPKTEKLVAINKKADVTIRGSHVDPIEGKPHQRVVNFPRNHPTVNYHIREFLCLWQANTDSKVIYDPNQVTKYLFKYICKSEAESTDFRKVAQASIDSIDENKSVRSAIQRMLIKGISKDTCLQAAHLELSRTRGYSEISTSFHHCSVGGGKLINLDPVDLNAKVTKENLAELYWRRHEDPNFHNACLKYDAFMNEGTLDEYFQQFDKRWSDPPGPRDANLHDFISLYDREWKPKKTSITPVVNPFMHRVPPTTKKELFEKWARARLLQFKVDCTPDNVSKGFEDITEAFKAFMKSVEKNPRFNFLKTKWEEAQSAGALNVEKEAAGQDEGQVINPLGEDHETIENDTHFEDLVPDINGNVILVSLFLFFALIMSFFHHCTLFSFLDIPEGDLLLHQDLLAIHGIRQPGYGDGADNDGPDAINDATADAECAAYGDKRFLEDYKDYDWQKAHDDLEMNPGKYRVRCYSQDKKLNMNSSMFSTV